MKKTICLLICILVLLCGCAAHTENTHDDYSSAPQNCELYDEIIEDYRNIVSFRLLDDFEYFWNYGEFIELSDPLLQALTVSGSDLDYRWSNMIIEMPAPDSAKESFGYILADINNDSCPELFWVRDDYSVMAVFTSYNDRIILLDAFWSRYSCVITDDGLLYTQGSGGADYIDYEIRKLSAGGVLTPVIGFSVAGIEYSELSGGEIIPIDDERFEELRNEYPFESSQNWLDNRIIPLTYD